MSVINHKRSIMIAGIAILSFALVILASSVRYPDREILDRMPSSEQTAYFQTLDAHNKAMPSCFFIFGVEADCPLDGTLPIYAYLGFLAIFAAIGMHLKSTQEHDMGQLKLGFRKHAEGDTTVFEAMGAGVGVGFWIGNLCLSLFLGLIVVFVLFRGDGRYFPTGEYVAFNAIWMGLVFLFDRARSRAFRISVATDHVEVAGRRYAKDDISELLIRHSGENVATVQAHSAPGVIVGGTGATGAAIAGAALASNVASGVGAAAGAAMKNSLDKRGFSVCLRYGAEVVPLAKYLKENVAISLFNEINRAY